VNDRTNRVDRFGSSRTRPWRLELQSSLKNAYLTIILCMWSNHDRIRPYAKYQRRERAGSRSKKENGVDHFVRAPRQLGAHKMTKTSAASGSFQLILCMLVLGGVRKPPRRRWGKYLQRVAPSTRNGVMTEGRPSF
jgi:hypothetical protein